MKLSTLAAAVLGALIAGGGVYFYYNNNTINTVSNVSPSASSKKLAIGETVSGQLTTNDLLNPSSGVYSAIYEFTPSADQLIKVSVSGALKSQLAVLRDQYLIQKDSVASCSDCGSSTKDQTSITVKVNANTPYQLVVSGVDQRSYGPYSLKVEELVPYDGKPLKGDQSITDWAVGKRVKYPLEITEEGIYTISLTSFSSEVDGYLQLRSSTQRLIAEDDDSGGELNPEISTYLQPGSYNITASSATSQRFMGGYELSISKQTLNLDDLSITPESDTLDLSETDHSGVYLSKPLTLSFELDQPQLVTITMESEQLSNDFSIDGYDSQEKRNDNSQEISIALGAGKHNLELNAGSASGRFLLTTAVEAIPAHIKTTALVINQPIEVTATSNIDAIAYELTITEAGSYSIYLDSDTVDTSLVLNQNNQLITKDDDSGGNLNALIEVNLEPGTYQVIAIGPLSQSQSFEVGVLKN